MTEEQPLALVLLLTLLRAINAVFLIATFPLHRVALCAASILLPGIAATALAGVARVAATIILISMLAGWLSSGPVLAQLLGFPGVPAAIVASVSSIFVTVYGCAVNEKGTRLDSPAKLRLRALLSGIVEAILDIFAAAGLLLVILGVVRLAVRVAVRLLPRSWRTAAATSTTGTSPHTQPPPTPSPEPPRLNWRHRVAHELTFTVVDILCLPAACCLGLMPWRLKPALRHVWAQPTESRRRFELIVQTLLACSDLPFFLLAIPVLLSVYRAPSLLRRLHRADAGSYKRVLASEALSLLCDLPFVLLATVVMFSWRMPLLLRDVTCCCCFGARSKQQAGTAQQASTAQQATTVADRRAAALTHSVLLILDLPALASLAIVSIGSHIAALLLWPFAAPPGSWDKEGPHRLGALRRSLKEQPQTLLEQVDGHGYAGGYGLEEAEWECADCLDADCFGGDCFERAYSDDAHAHLRELRRATWPSLCAIEQAAGLLLIDVPLLLLVLLPLLMSGWRALDLVDLVVQFAEGTNHGTSAQEPPQSTPSQRQSQRGDQRQSQALRRSSAAARQQRTTPPLPEGTSKFRRLAIEQLLLLLTADIPILAMWILALLVPWRTFSAVRVIVMTRHASDRRDPVFSLFRDCCFEIFILLLWLMPLSALTYAFLSRLAANPPHGLPTAPVYAAALAWAIFCRAARVIKDCVVWRHSAFAPHRSALHELLLLYLDPFYVLSNLIVLLTVYRWRLLQHIRREVNSTHWPLLRPFEPDTDLSDRLIDHSIVMSEAANVFVDIPFMVSALPALLAPWRCRIFLADAVYRSNLGFGDYDEHGYGQHRLCNTEWMVSALGSILPTSCWQTRQLSSVATAASAVFAACAASAATAACAATAAAASLTSAATHGA